MLLARLVVNSQMAIPRGCRDSADGITARHPAAVRQRWDLRKRVPIPENRRRGKGAPLVLAIDRREFVYRASIIRGGLVRK